MPSAPPGVRRGAGVPKVSTPRTEVIAELGEQLRFGSRKSLLRQLERIEELAAQIEDEGVYPEDFVVFRVTGYRPESGKQRMLPGLTLRGDLSALAERLSESAALTEQDLGGPVETVASLTARWGVTRRTLERYRRLGLVARRVDLGSGRRALVFSRAGVEAFERMQAARLGRAARFNRIADEELERLWSRAVRYRARTGWSLNRVAQRMAARSGRSPDGLRRALRRMDRARGQGVFPEPGPPTRRERALAVRAAARGIEPALLARRLGRRKSAVVRAHHDARAELLRDLSLTAARVADHDGGLRGEPARAGLSVDAPADLAGLIGQMRERVAPVAFEERARAAAYRVLMARAAAGIEAFPSASVSGAALDAVETDLRWAAMLKAALVRSQLTLGIETLEQRLGGPVDTLTPARAAALCLGVIGVIAEAVDRFDPSRGGRLAAPVGLALSRWCSGVSDVAVPPEAGRAARRAPSGVVVADWTRGVAPWQAWLLPDARVAAVLGRLGAADRVLLEARFGLGGTVPQTLESIAAASGKRALHLARAERRALREALRVARSAAEAGRGNKG